MVTPTKGVDAHRVWQSDHEELFDCNRLVENLRNFHNDDVSETQLQQIQRAPVVAGNFSPGRVILVRNVCCHVTEEDVESFIVRYCRSTKPKIYLQCGPSQALIEFKTRKEAEDTYYYYNQHRCRIHPSCIQILYACHDCVKPPPPLDKTSNFNILQVTIEKLLYPISHELISSLFSRFGEVKQVISFANNMPPPGAINNPSRIGLRILVSMVDAEAGRRAVLELNGRNIYDGCCTLNVCNYQHHQFRHDCQVVPTLMREAMISQKQSLMFIPESETQQSGSSAVSESAGCYTDDDTGQVVSESAKSLTQQQPFEELPMKFGRSENIWEEKPVPPLTTSKVSCSSPGFQKLMHISRLTREARDWKNSLMSHSPAPTPVLIVYNLTPEEVTVTELFNVFSIYGVVQRIKFLWDKPHTALVQYSDPLYASLALYFLQNAPFFDTDPGLQVGFSRNYEVKLPPMVPPELVKKMRAFTPQEQRYTVSEEISPDIPNEVEKFVRGACSPTCTLFIANLREQIGGRQSFEPFNFGEYEIRDIVSPFGRVNKIQMKSPGDGSRRRYAMVEMASRHEALYALAHLHNTIIDGSNVKVAFSKVVISDEAKLTIVTEPENRRPQTASTSTST